MKKVAIMTDSNSNISQEEGKEFGVYVLPMPFFIDGKEYFEGVSLTTDEFYAKQEGGSDISTSMPSPGNVIEMWEELLKEYDEIVHIPMTSGLSGSYGAAAALAHDYDGKIEVVDNWRISVSLRQAVLEAKALADAGKSAHNIRDHLEDERMDFSIYLMVDTLTYLKKGGRITPAAAALGTLLKIKPILKVDKDKLDAFAKARTVKQAKDLLVKATKDDFGNQFRDPEGRHRDLWIVFTKDREAALKFKEELKEDFPNHDIPLCEMPLSIASHTGPGVLALASTKKA